MLLLPPSYKYNIYRHNDIYSTSFFEDVGLKDHWIY